MAPKRESGRGMIFEDPSRRRWRRAQVLLLMAGGLGLILLSYLTFRILSGPPRPRRISSALEPARWFLDFAWTAIIVLFSSATAIAVARVAFLGSLITRRKRYDDLSTSSFRPPVTVLIPAYNEAEVIAATVDAVLACDYPDLTVIVIDDGSTDATAGVVAPYESAGRPLRLLRQPNGGKYTALNLGFEAAVTEYVVTIDADTRVLEDTISRIMAPFADPSIDAVCGNVRVGNVRNALTTFQDVEYVTSQNYERRAFDALNCIPVVPGATGAWRRSKVLGSGGYSADTLTEDTDLTLTILAAGGRIVYAPAARSNHRGARGCQGLLQAALPLELRHDPMPLEASTTSRPGHARPRRSAEHPGLPGPLPCPLPDRRPRTGLLGLPGRRPGHRSPGTSASSPSSSARRQSPLRWSDGDWTISGSC